MVENQEEDYSRLISDLHSEIDKLKTEENKIKEEQSKRYTEKRE